MSWKNRIREWRSTAVIFLAALAFSHSIAGGCVIPSGSMQPTLDPGDVVAVNRLAYGVTVPVLARQLTHWADPARGDVIIFNVPAVADASEPLYIKRVVAVAGDVIEVRNNRVILNGAAVPVQLTAKGPMENVGSVHRLIEGPGPLANMPAYRVPAGYVFVMGDHRNNSADSRAWGPLPIARVRGKALAVALSFDFNRWKVGETL
jgi:signal peptidase I